MDPIRIKLALVDVGAGLLFILLSVPLILRKIPMNHFYGFRIPKAFRSEEDWYDMNEHGGKVMLPLSIGLLIAGIIKFFIPLESLEGFAQVAFLPGPILVFTLTLIILTLVYAWKR